MSSPDFPQLFFSNRFCCNLSATVVLDILPGITIALAPLPDLAPKSLREEENWGADLKD